jgi:hypothetical protein
MFVSFANGAEPWTANRCGDVAAGGGVIMVADESDGWVEKSERDIERVQGRGVDVLDKLWDLWQEKKGKHFLPLNFQNL